MATAAAPAYSWTQTKEDLTVSVPLPAGTSSRSVQCEVAGTLTVTVLGNTLVSGALWGKTSSSMWTVDGGVLVIELEKTQARFWPCALQGDPEVDVEALKAKERQDNEPAYKMPPGADQQPTKVTDRESLLKLKAEFPHLDIPIAAPGGSQHAAHKGGRKNFSWGAVPPAAPAAASHAQPAGTPVAAADTREEVAGSAAPEPAESPSAPTAGKFQWGAVPSSLPSVEAAADAQCSGAASSAAPAAAPFSWGLLPGTVAPTSDASVKPPQIADCSAPQQRYTWGPLPPQ